MPCGRQDKTSLSPSLSVSSETGCGLGSPFRTTSSNLTPVRESMSVSSIFLPMRGEPSKITASVKNSFRSMSEIMLLKASLSGSNLLPKRTRKPRATKRIGSPIFDSSNMPRGSISGKIEDSLMMPLAKMLVLVPTKVQQPPKIEA